VLRIARDAERLRSPPLFIFQAKLEASAALKTETEMLKNSVLAAQEEMAELQQQKAAAQEQVAGLLLENETLVHDKLQMHAEKETLEHDKQQMHAALAALQAETDSLKAAAQKSDDMIVDVQHARLQADVLRQELQAETGKVLAVQAALVTLEQAHAHLQGKAMHAEQELENTSQQLVLLQGKCHELEAQYHELERKYHERVEVEAAAAEAEKDAQVQALKADKAQLGLLKDNLEMQLSKVERARKDEAHKTLEAEGQHASVRAQLHGAEEQIASLSSQLSSALAAAECARAAAAKATEERTAMAHELKNQLALVERQQAQEDQVNTYYICIYMDTEICMWVCGCGCECV